MVTFSLGPCAAAERAVFILDEMAAEDNVLTGLGVVPANPGQRNNCRYNHIIIDIMVQ